MAQQAMQFNAEEAFNPPSKRNTCAVVITYHPNTSLFDRIKAVASQVGRVVIVDNTPGNEAVGLLYQFVEGKCVRTNHKRR